MTRKIIAFVGKAGSGKDYSCNKLVEQGYIKVAFADALRKITFAALGYSYEYGMEHYDELKQTPLINGLTLRNIMERLSTEGIRNYVDDFWIRCLIKTLDDIPEDTNVCVSDLRFYNEWEALYVYTMANGYDFKVTFCDYHSDRYEDNNPHISAKLANDLCLLGLKDQEEISNEVMQRMK